MNNPKGYDSIARFYDLLARLVFGKSIALAQTHFLKEIPFLANVLVVGGGSGWWMKEFLRSRPHCKIVFIDLSAEMIRLAREGVQEDKRISFRCGSEESITEVATFDVVITFFFLDLFSSDSLPFLVRRISESLKPGGLWLVSDFVETRWWHSALLSAMYRFFRFTTGLQNQSLPDWNEILLKNNLRPIDHKTFYSDFIKSGLYQSK